MEVENLKLFVEVMQRRNFTGIARERNIAPSSVSRAITALEKELGIRLFQRSTRKLEATEAGMVYFDRISSILDDLESAKHLATDLSEQPRGTLRVTASTVFGGIYIVPLLPELAEKYPALSVDLNLTDTYLDLIEERIDIAVRLGTLQDSTYIAKRLSKLESGIYASPDYIKKYGKPQQPQQISEHKCLLFPRTGNNSNWLFRDKQQNIQNIAINYTTRITNLTAIKQCTLYGMGISLIPNWLAEQEIAQGELVRLFSDYDVTATDYESSVWLVYPSREYLALKSRVFIDLLTTRFKQNN